MLIYEFIEWLKLVFYYFPFLGFLRFVWKNVFSLWGLNLEVKFCNFLSIFFFVTLWSVNFSDIFELLISYSLGSFSLTFWLFVLSVLVDIAELYLVIDGNMIWYNSITLFQDMNHWYDRDATRTLTHVEYAFDLKCRCYTS